jgi:hypothetical protein
MADTVLREDLSHLLKFTISYFSQRMMHYIMTMLSCFGGIADDVDHWYKLRIGSSNRAHIRKLAWTEGSHHCPNAVDSSVAVGGIALCGEQRSATGEHVTKTPEWRHGESQATR